MFLTLSEVNVLLQNPLFTLPVIETVREYQFYRGRRKVTALTVRFNLVPTFDLSFMKAALPDKLLSYHPLGSHVSVAVRYDLLLRSNSMDDSGTMTPSYYIWRANTNQTTLEDNNLDVTMPLTYPNIDQMCEKAVNINLHDDLNIEFVNSDVVIDRVLAILLTFCPVT